MEASSPLAAMHPAASMAGWGGGQDIFRSHTHPHYPSGAGGIGSRALRERLQKTDYFNIKDVSGSSPAATLAADLSQNFRIDNDVSPQFPTPRRALFTANMMGGTESRGFCTTPPLPSSSPAPMTETMELSPLPHKAPFTTQLEIVSPSPISTPANDEDVSMMLDSPPPIPRQASLDPPNPVVTDRKIAALRRPSLTRAKGNSTTAIPGRVQDEHQLPSFRFGLSSTFNQPSPGLSLGECFESASPPQERRPQSANTPSVPLSLIRPRLPTSTSSSRNGSPAAGHVRRQSNPYLRSRKQFRRSLSMFEHPADIMMPHTRKEEPGPSGLQSVMDVEESDDPALPHFFSDDPTDTIPRITKETLLQVMDGHYMERFDQKMIVDCRFEYEYDGGHIEGAVNHNDKDLLASQLFQTPIAGRSLLVFHCEYSAHRAPLMARHVRSEDRTANAEQYPKLTYPEVYILDGGYSAFFAEHRSRCFPPEYVEMSDAKHQRTCEREMGRLKQRKGFGRAQTFAFGQREPCGGLDSPTAPNRPSSRHAPLGMLGDSPRAERSQTRRMASY